MVSLKSSRSLRAGFEPTSEVHCSRLGNDVKEVVSEREDINNKERIRFEDYKREESVTDATRGVAARRHLRTQAGRGHLQRQGRWVAGRHRQRGGSRSQRPVRRSRCCRRSLPMQTDCPSPSVSLQMDEDQNSSYPLSSVLTFVLFE